MYSLLDAVRTTLVIFLFIFQVFNLYRQIWTQKSKWFSSYNINQDQKRAVLLFFATPFCLNSLKENRKNFMRNLKKLGALWTYATFLRTTQKILTTDTFHSRELIAVILKKNQTNIYLFKVNNGNTKKRWGTYSKLTIKSSNWRHWCRSGLVFVNFGHISHLFVVFLLMTLHR